MRVVVKTCFEIIVGEEGIMFWRDRERENKELNGGVLCGQVRVLVVGDSGSCFCYQFCFLLIL